MKTRLNAALCALTAMTAPALAQQASPWPMDYKAAPVEAQLAKVKQGAGQRGSVGLLVVAEADGHLLVDPAVAADAPRRDDRGEAVLDVQPRPDLGRGDVERRQRPAQRRLYSTQETANIDITWLSIERIEIWLNPRGLRRWY